MWTKSVTLSTVWVLGHYERQIENFEITDYPQYGDFVFQN